jgi:hypothetical protein
MCRMYCIEPLGGQEGYPRGKEGYPRYKEGYPGITINPKPTISGVRYSNMPNIL